MSTLSLQRSEWISISMKNNVADDKKKKRFREPNAESGWFHPCCCGCCIGALLAGLALAIVLTLWLTSSTARVKIESTQTTQSSTSTSSTTRTTTTSETTSTTTSTSTSSTSTTTSATTTTTTLRICDNILQWNQTAETVAGTGTAGTAATNLNDPVRLEINSENSLYICDQSNKRIQKWLQNASNGTTVALSSTDVPVDLAVGQNDTVYVLYQSQHYVALYNNTPTIGTQVAGVRGTSSNATNHLSGPSGLTIDNDNNLYIADTNNRRVVKWESGAASGSVVIQANSSYSFTDIVLVPGTSNQVYISSTASNVVYQWTFGSTSPSSTLRQVNDSVSTTLRGPRGIKVDPYGNLYVADSNNDRIVRFCSGETLGTVVVDENWGPVNLLLPVDLAFDSALNLYLVDHDANKIFRYAKL